MGDATTIKMWTRDIAVHGQRLDLLATRAPPKIENFNRTWLGCVVVADIPSESLTSEEKQKENSPQTRRSC